MIDLGRSQTRSNISSQIELWIQNSGTKMNRIPKPNQKKSGGGGGGEEEAVDSLLRAAEDELLLNLSLNSHMSRGISHSCNSHIDPDLDRRFQSLKSSRRPPTSTKNPPPQPPAYDDGDLLARFAALKGDSISSSSCFQESNCLQSDRGKISSSDAVDQDEVQKLIQWAIDAARLDPSSLTDSDDENHRHDDDSSNDDDSNSDEGFSDHGGSKDNRKKGGRNKGQKGK